MIILPRGQRRLAAVAVLLAASVAAPSRAPAQGYPASPRSTLTQNVALAEVSITYGRPVARGRVLFGQLVPWDSVWHPGADSASRLSVSKDILVEGQPLKAGEYSIWLIPREKEPWTFIVSRSARVWHRTYPGQSNDALRIEIAPEVGAHMESLAFYFPQVVRDDAVLRFHWGTTILPLRIKVP